MREFIQDLPEAPAGGFEDGAHTYGYMRRVLPNQLRFLGANLTA
ncbi:hypothetical protein ABIE44_001001 [Marmoricola sp. OAE513]